MKLANTDKQSTAVRTMQRQITMHIHILKKAPPAGHKVESAPHLWEKGHFACMW